MADVNAMLAAHRPEGVNAMLQAAPKPQTWGDLLSSFGRHVAGLPGEMVNSAYEALTLPARAYSGEVPTNQMMPEAFNFAGNVALGGYMAPKPANSLGTFGGRMAKTADREALARAEGMAAQGVPREQVWRDTGWFQGVDGNWRFEIDDTYASAKNGVGVGLDGPVFSHTPALEAYPDAASLRIGVGTAGQKAGQFSPSERTLIAVGPDPESQTSVALHELQHFIQNKEGLASGGSPKGFVLDHIADKFTGGKTAFEKYRKLAGEVESRAVEQRWVMTPEQRRARPPWLDYDVPEASQIVKIR